MKRPTETSPETSPETSTKTSRNPSEAPPGTHDEAGQPSALRCTSTPCEQREVELLGERIAVLAAQISAATYQLLVMLREFDERDGWSDGFRSCAHWLSWRTGLALGPAREKVRVARALATLPRLSEEMRTGRLSYSKVRALTRVATPDNEEQLIEFAHAGTAWHVERVVRAWRRIDREHERHMEEVRHESRYLHVSQEEDGMVVVRGRLEPEAGAALMRALEAAADVLYDQDREKARAMSDGVPPAQRRADAIGRLAESALASGLDKGSRGDRYQVVVHVDAGVLAEEDVPAGTSSPAAGSPGQSVLEGHHVPAGTSRRIACDASKVVMTHDSEGRMLDVGRRTRVVPPAIRRALDHRDRGCRFPGCGLKFCEAHHVKHWSEGGETRLDNLVLLCRRHHRLVHEEGYRLKQLASGELQFLEPSGRALPAAPSSPDLPDEPLLALADRLEESGVDLDALGAWPLWDGSRLNLHEAMQGLWIPTEGA